MKKILILLLLISFCILPLASCIEENKECTNHTWSEYQFDENEHWREYTCGCPTPDNKQSHQLSEYIVDDEGHYRKCFCGYIEAHQEHEYNSFGHDDYVHWDSCICGSTKESAIKIDHSDENKDGRCDICKARKHCDHVYSEETYFTFLEVTLAPHDPCHINYVRCIHCGEVRFPIEEGTGKEYSISLGIGADEYCNSIVPTSAKAGDYVTIRVPKFEGDLQIAVKINNDIYAFGIMENDEYTRTLAFIMPDVDTKLDFYLTNRTPSIYKHTAYFYYYDTWFMDANPDDVCEIKYVCSKYENKDSNLIPYYYITNKEDVTKLFYKLKLTHAYAGFEGYPRDFVFETYTLILEDGTTHKISLRNGYYEYGVELLSKPLLTDFESVQVYYQFDDISDEGQIYKYESNNEILRTIDTIGSLKFVPCADEKIETLEPTYYIETSFKTLYIVNNKTFYLIDENGKKTYYTLINLDFYEIIDDEQFILQTYQNLGHQNAYIIKYYGKYESGAIVALLSAEGYFDYCTSEKVADFTFNYPNQNHIQVLYDGSFYSLSSAYQNGYLTYENVAEIYQKHITK